MGVHRETWAKWERGERRPDNAATQLMRLLCWLREKRGPALTQWLREI
jgi:DNA-binding transcriptional regulator YiaG